MCVKFKESLKVVHFEKTSYVQRRECLLYVSGAL